MKTALLQSNLIWENPQANRDHFSEQIIAITEDLEIIVLPEMFSSGFTMNPESVAETMQGDTIFWMKMMAQNKNCAIMGSVVIVENDQYYNRLIFVYPSGTIQTYDKRHLFSLAGEDKAFRRGTEKLIIDYNGFKICPLICYDLRFPVFSRNAEDYDLLVYVANWPKARIQAWDVLLQARAIENISYVIGVNRVGADGNGHEYIGHSQAFDPLGNAMIESCENEAVLFVEIEKKNLQEVRQKFAFLNDRDTFTVEG